MDTRERPVSIVGILVLLGAFVVGGALVAGGVGTLKGDIPVGGIVKILIGVSILFMGPSLAKLKGTRGH